MYCWIWNIRLHVLLSIKLLLRCLVYGLSDTRRCKQPGKTHQIMAIEIALDINSFYCPIPKIGEFLHTYVWFTYMYDICVYLWNYMRTYVLALFVLCVCTCLCNSNCCIIAILVKTPELVVWPKNVGGFRSLPRVLNPCSWCRQTVSSPGPLLPTWLNFNTSMDK